MAISRTALAFTCLCRLAQGRIEMSGVVGKIGNTVSDRIEEIMNNTMLGDKLPMDLQFEKNAPQFRMYPGGSFDNGDNETWAMLTFGKVQELNANRMPIVGQMIESLADAASMMVQQEDRMIGGAAATVTTMTMPLTPSEFMEECVNFSWTDGRRRLDGTEPNITIEIIVFVEAGTIEYGDQTFEVEAGELKFNIQAEEWPFCDMANTLQVAMDLKLASLADTYDSKEDLADALKTKVKSMVMSAGSMNLTMLLPDYSLVNEVSEHVDIDISMRGGTATILFEFPYFSGTMVYDPIASFEADTSMMSATSTDMNMEKSTMMMTTTMMMPMMTTSMDEMEATSTDMEKSTMMMTTTMMMSMMSTTMDEMKATSTDMEKSMMMTTTMMMPMMTTSMDDMKAMTTKADSMMTTTQQEMQTMLYGSFSVDIGDTTVSSFCANDAVLAALETGAASAMGLSSGALSVTCATRRRLDGGAAGRFLAGNVAELDYTATLQASSAQVDAIVATIEAVSTEDLTTALGAALDDANLSMELSVTSMSDVSQTEGNMGGATSTKENVDGAAQHQLSALGAVLISLLILFPSM